MTTNTTTDALKEKGIQLMRELKQNKEALAGLEAGKKSEMLSVQSRFEESTAPYKRLIDQAEKELAELAAENEELLFSESETIITPYGVYGYRNNPASLQLEYTDEETITMIEKSSLSKKVVKLLIAVKKSLDKTAIKKEFSNSDSAAILADCGLSVGSQRVFKYDTEKTRL